MYEHLHSYPSRCSSEGNAWQRISGSLFSLSSSVFVGILVHAYIMLERTPSWMTLSAAGVCRN